MMNALQPHCGAETCFTLSLRSLALTDFRNYAAARLECVEAPVILTGHNGAGKTNILEAVSLLAPGRGMRRARLLDLDRRQANGPPLAWTVAANVRTPLGEISIGTGREADPASATLQEREKRLVRIDGKTARGQVELAQHVSLLWLTPQMDQLFMEGQSARRKFLDRLVFSFDAEHAARVNAYDYAMRERNRLLALGRADPHWLDSLERKLAEGAVAIGAARLSTVAHLNEVMQCSPLSFPKAQLALSGTAENALLKGEPAVEAERMLTEALRQLRREDALSGRTAIGAHRSELTVTHMTKGMEAALCSTGEQKALLLATVLAEARAGALWHGRVPLLLLDEVVAHLDPDKRSELYEEISALNAQAWMTGTDAHLFEGMLGRAQFFRVERGGIIPA